jgi:hypothetical protein
MQNEKLKAQMRLGLAKSCLSFGIRNKQISAARSIMANNPAALQKIHAAFMNKIEWPQNHVITIGWMDDFIDANARSKYATLEKTEWVKHVILNTLQPLVNLEFKFLPLGTTYDASNAPTIRIAFDPSEGASSYIGKENMDIPTSVPTMNLGWLDNQQLDQSLGSNEGGVVIHEFGHMIGLMHEHQREDVGKAEKFEWASNEEIMKFFTGPPNNWPESMVLGNVINKIAVTEFNGSKYDPDSIMHYVLNCMCFKDGVPPVGLQCIKPVCTVELATAFPKAPCLARAGMEDTANPQHLSPLDKQTISEKYPRADAVTETKEVVPDKIETQVQTDTSLTETDSSQTELSEAAESWWTPGNIVLVSILTVIAAICLGLFIYWMVHKPGGTELSSINTSSLVSTSRPLITPEKRNF